MVVQHVDPLNVVVTDGPLYCAHMAFDNEAGEQFGAYVVCRNFATGAKREIDLRTPVVDTEEHVAFLIALAQVAVGGGEMDGIDLGGAVTVTGNAVDGWLISDAVAHLAATFASTDEML